MAQVIWIRGRAAMPGCTGGLKPDRSLTKGNPLSTFWWIVIIAAILVAGLYYLRYRRAAASRSLTDSAKEARRWVERLGGQVYSLDPMDDAAARQALADAAERFTAAGAQVDQATSEQQYRLAQQTAYEGLYYVSAARTALGLDPGPQLPPIPGQQQAGAVTEDRSVTVDGRRYTASPRPGERTQHYYPGGLVAGHPVPQGWYSEPWWSSALDAGAWSVGSYLIASTLLIDTAGVGWSEGYQAGLHADNGSNGDDDRNGDYVHDDSDGVDSSAGDFGGDPGDF